MAIKYRQNRDEKVDLKRTQSSTSDDPILNKAKQISRKNDDVKNISVGIYDIDLAFKDFLEKDVRPTIEENGKFIPVPVLYASPENWVSAQRDGFIRDANGKAQTPLISFKRNSLDVNTEYSKLKVMTDDDTSRTFVKKYTPKNRYDAFSQLIDSKPIDEYHIVDNPDYVNISYDVIVWCDYMEDLNKVVEQIIYFQGGVFGERYKFQIKGESYSFETTNGVGEERIVKSNVTLTSKAYIIPEDRGKRVMNSQKTFGTSKIVWNTRLDT
jgi:hypothetical protein|tara:strand:- start:623 stop:1429 length:807 start_codon:yes stop_codon:yes gene_type:complete